VLTDNKKPEFYLIPTPVAEKVNPQVAMVYAVVYWFANLKEGRCFASNKRIAEAMPQKSTAASIANALTKLEEAGLILRRFSDSNRYSRAEIIPLVTYVVLDKKELDKRHYFIESPVGGGSSTGEGGVHPQVKGGSPTDEHIRKLTRKDITYVISPDKRLDNKKDTSSISKQSKINTAAKEVYEWAQKKHGRKFTNPGKQFKALHTSLNAGFSPDQIKRKWNDMMGEDFWTEKGFDFANVASQLSKHASK